MTFQKIPAPSAAWRYIALTVLALWAAGAHIAVGVWAEEAPPPAERQSQAQCGAAAGQVRADDRQAGRCIRVVRKALILSEIDAAQYGDAEEAPASR